MPNVAEYSVQEMGSWADSIYTSFERQSPSRLETSPGVRLKTAIDGRLKSRPNPPAEEPAPGDLEPI